MMKCIGALVKGITQILLSPKYNESDFAGIFQTLGIPLKKQLRMDAECKIHIYI